MIVDRKPKISPGASRLRASAARMVDSSMQEPLEALLLRASRGEAPALDALLERYLPGLRAYVRLRAGPRLLEKESSSDLVQSVCRDILENEGRFQFDGETGFRRWLYKTAQRKIADRYEFYGAKKRDIAREKRQRGKDSGGDDAALLDCYRTFCTPSHQAMAREELTRVERAFASLPEEQREVIVQAKILGLTRPEIAESLGKTEGAVRTLLYRALARLSEILEDPA